MLYYHLLSCQGVRAHVSLSVFLILSLSISLSLSLSVPLSLSLSRAAVIPFRLNVCVYVSLSLSISLPVSFASVCLSFSLSLDLNLFHPFSPCSSPSVFLSFPFSLFLSFSLSLSLSQSSSFFSVRTIKIAGRLRKIQEFLREKNVGKSRKRGNQEREREIFNGNCRKIETEGEKFPRSLALARVFALRRSVCLCVSMCVCVCCVYIHIIERVCSMT